MDHVMDDRVRDDEQFTRIASAMTDGVIVVDADGRIVWIDKELRRRLNGDLANLDLPVRRPVVDAVDCFITAKQLVIGDKPSSVCVIQQCGDEKEPGQFIAAIEAVMSDGSWLTRMIVDKVKALRQQGASAPNRSSDVDILTDREREVLWLICEGRSDAEMSEKLGLSQNTVRNHIASLYRKIGVNRRSAAIIWARERAMTSHDALARRRPKRSRPGGDSY